MEKTLAGALDEGGARLRIFRQRSTVQDNLSAEIYSRVDDGWERQREERVKYMPPEEFAGECLYVDDVPVWSREKLDASQLSVLRGLLRRRR